MKTFRRDRLRRLVEAGKVETVSTYSFDDMHGEHRTDKPMAVAMKPDDYRERKQGVCYLTPHDFDAESGRAWIGDNGIITLYVHSNSHYDLRIKPCEHNAMVPTRSPTHAWKCADCGYVYNNTTGTIQ